MSVEPPTAPADDPALRMQQLRANIVSNAIKKGATGFAIGTALSFMAFKRMRCRCDSVGRLPPIMLTTGFALGLAYAEGNQMVRDATESLRARAALPNEHEHTPPGLRLD